MATTPLTMINKSQEGGFLYVLEAFTMIKQELKLYEEPTPVYEFYGHGMHEETIIPWTEKEIQHSLELVEKHSIKVGQKYRYPTSGAAYWLEIIGIQKDPKRAHYQKTPNVLLCKNQFTHNQLEYSVEEVIKMVRIDNE